MVPVFGKDMLILLFRQGIDDQVLISTRTCPTNTAPAHLSIRTRGSAGHANVGDVLHTPSNSYAQLVLPRTLSAASGDVHDPGHICRFVHVDWSSKSFGFVHATLLVR